MEGIFGENACKHEGKYYPDGSEFCLDEEREETCKVCQNGEWEDRMTGFWPAAG